jgi:hypothetical protein
LLHLIGYVNDASTLRGVRLLLEDFATIKRRFVETRSKIADVGVIPYINNYMGEFGMNTKMFLKKLVLMYNDYKTDFYSRILYEGFTHDCCRLISISGMNILRMCEDPRFKRHYVGTTSHNIHSTELSLISERML